MLRFWTCILFLLIPICSLPAQSHQINIRKFGTDEGLSHATVSSIMQDREGFLWVGTKYGLNRFDGHNFTWFTKQTHGLQAKQVSHILQASDHRLWLLERLDNIYDTIFSSFELFDPHAGQSRNLDEVLDHPLPFSLKLLKWVDALPDGRLLLSTRQASYILHDQQGWEKTPIPKGFRLISAFNEKDIWGMLGSNLIQLNLEGEVLQQFPFKATRKVFQVKQERSDRYWIVLGDAETGRGGLNSGEIWLIDHGKKQVPLIDLQFNQPYEFQLEIFRDQAAIYLMHSNTCWYWNDSLQQLLPIPSFVSERGKKMDDVFYHDKQGILWYGHREGLWAIQRKKNPFQHWMKGEKGSMFPTRGIGQQGNRLYINSSKECISIDLKRGEKTSLIETYPQFRRFKPFSVAQTTSAELWTASDNLYQLDSMGYISREIKLPPEASRVWAFFQDSEETWWIASGEDQIYYFNEAIHESPRPFDQHNGFQAVFNARKWHITASEHGIWLASQDGLFLLNKGKGIIARYAEDETGRYYLPSRIFHHVYCDIAGIMWLATGNAGLLRVAADSLVVGDEKPDFHQITRSQGLPSNELYASLEDHAGHLWISTANGLVQLNKQSLEINTYFEEQGITHNEFNRLSYYQDLKGRMYFGGLNGVNSFDPKDFYEKTAYQPPLVLADVELFSGKENRLIKLNQQVKETKVLDYYPGDTYLKLQFSLQDYFHSDQIRYFYRIEGYQDDWFPMNANELQLSGLPYGNFQLRVRGQGPDKRFSENQAVLNLRVHRPFYLKIWFLVLLAIAIGLSLWQVYYWRIKALQKRQLLLERMVQERTQKIMEDKLTIEQQATELQELNEMKSRFFANVSHELRTPLTLILGPLARVLRRDRLEKTDQRALGMMQANGQQLLKRINELLDLSRLEAKKMTVNRQALQLEPFLQQLLASFQAAAQLKSIQLSLDFRPDKSLQLFTDKDKLEKILSNFLSNAVKFTPDGGRVSLEVSGSRFRVSGEQATRNPKLKTRNYLTIAVSDTGPGLPPEDLEKVFDRFYQARSTDQASGTGIGLSLAKELAELMEGKVWTESEVGKGASFFLEIPLEEVTGQTQQVEEVEMLPTLAEKIPAPVSQGKAQQATILLAEDNPDMQQYIREVLFDYEVITANNGAEALKGLATRSFEDSGQDPKSETRNSPDLIISDIMMPVMDGMAFLSHLKADDQLCQIPVIMLTARAGLESKLEALRIGIDDYLTKPFHEEELRARISNLLRNMRSRKARVSVQTEEAAAAAEEPAPSAADLKWLQEVESRILQGIGDSRFNLGELADQLALSPRRLQQKIKSLTGLTPKQYQREIQLEQARRLLESGAFATVAEVSYQVGFDAPHYFSSLYQKRYGKKPSSY